MKSNSEKIAALEARKKSYEEKIQTYKELITECTQKIDALKSQETKTCCRKATFPLMSLSSSSLLTKIHKLITRSTFETAEFHMFCSFKGIITISER